MRHLDRILVGVDYSECCENALKEASRIANWNDGKLICLHVFDEEILEDFRRYEKFDEAAVIDEARRRLELFVADQVGAGHDIECVVRVGHPFKELIHGVKEWDAGLLVLGSRGFKQDDPRRTGIFATRCIRKAPVEVLLVRKHQSQPFSRIVACVDFSDTSRDAAERAIEVAAQDGGKLELLHCYLSPVMAASDAYGLGPALPPVDSAESLRTLEQKLSDFADEVSKGHPEVEVTATVREGVSISKTIINRLNEVEADLVVLGTRGRTGLKKLLMGTTAERLIHETPCSALTIKPEGFHFEID